MPLLETIDLILEYIYDKGDSAGSFPRNVFQKLLLLCTQSSCFIFNGDLNEQIDGIAMDFLQALFLLIFLCMK